MKDLRERRPSLRDFPAENGGVGGDRTLDQRIKSPLQKAPITAFQASSPLRRVARKPRKPPAIEGALRDSSRVLACHGSLTILEVRDERGRRALRYAKEQQGRDDQ